MKNNKCIIAPYIKEKKLPKQEEERLDAINTDIFSRLNASGFFKRTAEGQLHTKSQKLSQASLLVRDINRSFNKNIVSLKKLPLDVKARRRASDFIAHVNVLPLYEEPPTQEQLDNRIALLENEPYIDPQERFSGLRPKVKVVKGKIITDQGIPVEEYLELQDAIYGPQPKNQPEVSNLQYKQGKLFNIQSLKRGAQDFSIEEKYFSEGLETTSGEILKKIANSKHPLAPLAKKLIEYDPEVPIRLVKKDAIEVDGFEAAAVYANKKRYIEIAKYAKFRGLGSEPTLIHEILHAATFDYIRKYPSSKEVKALSELYNIAKQNSEQLRGDKYALENLDEFVVGIFTDGALVSFLKDLPASESIPKGENLFESILNHILSLFGITEATPSLYSQAFQIASEIVVNNNQEQSFESQFEGQVFDAQVSYQLKGVQKILDNLPKVEQWYKQIKDKSEFWNKVQKDLQIPKDQIELLKEQQGSSIEEIISSFAGNYSYVIEINTAKTNIESAEVNNELDSLYVPSLQETYYFSYRDGWFKEDKNQDRIIASEEELSIIEEYKNKDAVENSSHYIYLTVPGGINYTENEIAIPDQLITEIPKGIETKQGVDSVFEQTPELANIGTPEQYSQYLDTIFPDSKVKDIVYHGANEPIEGENFTKREGATGGGIWFSGSRKYAQIQMDRAQPSESLIGRKLRGAPTMYQVVLNIKNPKNFYNATGALLVQTPSKFEEQYDRKNNDAALFHHPNSKKPTLSDSADQVVVFEPEQIHILGSKQDVEGFRNFIKNNTTTKTKQGIVPSIKGHAQFSTDNGIGWFRSDDKVTPGEDYDELLWEEEGYSEPGVPYQPGKKTIQRVGKYNVTKTRRILEVQSDLFQKGRDKEQLVLGSTTEEELEAWPDIPNKIKNPNQFLQLLNKDNAWVTFFIKSIIQDSVKQGYEKVLFPNGNTASKVEGHTTLEEFKKQKEFRLQNVIGTKEHFESIVPEQDGETYFMLYPDGNESLRYESKEAVENSIKKEVESANREIEQLKKELKDVEENGLAKLKPIYNFYENTVGNILKKQYGVKQIVDEYGNTWNEIDLSDQKVTESVSPIVFNIPSAATYQTKASEKTVAKIRELLNTLGIPVETSERILAEFGANGFADATKGIIEIANGKEDVALTEEAMHMLSMMVPSEVLDTLIDEITKYNIYKDTFRQYSKYSEYQNEDGSPNVEKIKLEAVGKLLAEYYIMSAEDLSPEEVNIAKTLWARIVEWVTSKFAANVDVFQEFINNVNNGTLQLGENFSRAERLANFEFTRHNSEDLANNLTRGTTLADLSDPARSNDKNIKILNDISNLIKSIKIDDLPIMQNLKNYINLPTKKIFATTKLKLEESVDATDIRNRITSAIEYVRNTYTAVAMLEERSNNIRKMLKDGVDINGTALDVKQRLYLFNEIARITELATMYEEHMTEFYLIFEGEQIGMGLDDVISDIKGTASRVIDNNSALDISNLTEVFREALKPKVEGYKRHKMKDILKLQDALNNTTSVSAQAKIQTKIDKLQSEYDNPPISAENVIALITEHDPDEAENKEKIKELRKKLVSASKEEKEKINKQIRKLKGVRIQNPFPLFMEGGLTHKDEAVQAVANLLATGTQEANKESQADVEKYLEIFSRSGLKQNISNSAYNKFTEVVTRYHFDERNGELEEYEEYRLLSEAAQWQFENDIEVLKFLIHIAETNPVEDFIQEEHEKHFGAVLTPAELVDMKGSLEKKLKDLIDNYGERRYIDLYYDIQQILDDVVLSDGRTVREYRQPFADAIAAADDEIELAIDPVTLEIALEDKKTALFEMSRLESEYDLATGLKKTGDELLVAQTIAQWKSAKRNVEVRPGVVVNVDEWFASNVAKAKWEEEKLAIEDRVSAAEASYALRPSAANRVALEQVSLEYQNWRAQNVKMEIPQAFYDERNDIISAIQDIIDANKADPDIEEAFKEDMDVLWAKIFSATKGLRDSDGIINGILSLSLSNEIKFFEGQIEELKSALKKFRKRFNSDEYMEIMILMDMLDEIQDTPLTKYWDEVYTAMTGQIEADLIARDGEVPTYDQIMMEFKETDFFKTNMLDVTRQYMNTKKADLPKNVIRIKGKTYKPIYTWRQTEPKGQYARVDAMSTTWMSYKVNDEFKNKNYETMQGKVSINPAKVVRNPVTPGRYESPKYAALSASERDFLKEVKEIYYRDQQTKKKSERLGDALPRISSRGLHRKTQLLNPWNWRLKGMFNKQSLLDMFVGLDATEREDVYGEGVSEIGRRTRDAKRQAIKDQRINVMAKYINKSLPIRSQEKDLFRLLTMYNIESHRAAKMKELLPAINTIAANLDKSKNRSKGIMYEINKRVNKKGRTTSNTLLRILDKITDTAHSSLAFTRLFMPHLISSSVKNSAVGAYQIWVNASKLGQYTESSFVAAYMRAFKGALKVTLQQFSSTPSKYMAVVRRLNVSANLDINDATINNADLLLKVANGLGYAAGAQRRVSELHLELTMFELLRKNHGLGGSDLLDLYDYNNGVLTPKMIPITDVDGNVTMQPAITPEQELGITNRAKNMQQFTQGNFSEDNAIYAKSFWLGRVLLFMKGFIYNPAMVRFGSKRIVSTGQEIEGFYKIALATIFTDTSSLWHPSRLTDNERDAVLKFTKEFILLNGFGLLLYQFSKAMKESGDDDKEEQGLWYLLLMLRRTYSEASFFSPAEAALKPFVLADEDNRVRGNQIESFTVYAVARPASELAYSAFLPVDIKGMRFEDDDIKTKDPYYSQFKNNWLLFDFLKAIKFKSDMKYPKSTLQSFEYYDKSIYAYEKNKGKAKRTRSNKKKNY